MEYDENKDNIAEELETSKTIASGDEDKDARADVFLANHLPLSRANIQKLMKSGLVFVDEKIIKPNYRLRGGETFTLDYQPPQPIQVEPEDITLNIVYQDKELIVVNKARGMVVHPAVGHYQGTLVNALLYHCKDLSGINGYIRPGIVHRLDKDTSGLMVVAKNDSAHVDLAAQIQSKKAVREYLAIVHGVVKTDEGHITTLIGRDPKDRQKMAVVEHGGREAITRYQVAERFCEHTLLRVQLFTGRTHQIRVHMSYLGYPLVGDPKYLPRRHGFAIKGQALHSYRLEVFSLEGERRCFTAELPDDMVSIVNKLRQK